MASTVNSRVGKGTASPDQRRAFVADLLPEEFVPLEFLGGGAMADVWRVTHRVSGEMFALKMLRADWADYTVTQRLLENEAEVGAAVNSRYVVKVFAADLESSPPFLLMEWLDGEILENVLREQGKLAYIDALWIARQCAEGLESLRQAGYTHGDIKPANLLLAPDGSLKLLDLGFARRCRKIDADQIPTVDILTGTPEYLAPEALSAEPSWGVARDIYSLGVTLFQMLTGRLPFQAQQPGDLLRSQLGATPPKVRQFAADVPRELEELVAAMLAKQPVRRPQSLERLIRVLMELELANISSNSAAA
ncbi:serine/threonine-protein kinase [Symmachiella dynata]|uniref:serine/threonine-protein kinase n=1 Tax=Symmachiella dynata TaxID=2527995 RepID=UPI0030ECA024